MNINIPSKKILLLLDSAAFIIQKYSLGDYYYFLNIFKKYNVNLLTNCWNNALEKTKDTDIINDTPYLDLDDEETVQEIDIAIQLKI